MLPLANVYFPHQLPEAMNAPLFTQGNAPVEHIFDCHIKKNFRPILQPNRWYYTGIISLENQIMVVRKWKTHFPKSKYRTTSVLIVFSVDMTNEKLISEIIKVDAMSGWKHIKDKKFYQKHTTVIEEGMVYKAFLLTGYKGRSNKC